MSKKYELKIIPLSDLILDKDNPRFAELYSGSEQENDIIEYLLFDESADEIAKAIIEAGEFYEDRPLWVYATDGKYIVKDGNRRCSAIKALQIPKKFGLDLPKFEVQELPVLQYKNLSDLETRIRVEHNSNLFKKWGRIAKAIEIYRLFSTGSSIESLTKFDSKPKEFIKLASFYHEANKVKGEDFKKLVREGRGRTGGKTIIFERLFKKRGNCGYAFKNNSSEITIKDKNLFNSYIKALVEYLIDNPNTKTQDIDRREDKFLLELKQYNFPPQIAQPSAPQNAGNYNTSSQNANPNNQNQAPTAPNSSGIAPAPQASANTPPPTTKNNGTGRNSPRHSIKKVPELKRKKIPSGLKRRIDECYKLDENNFANSKYAAARVAFECTLKYVVAETFKQNGKPLKISSYFNKAFRNSNGGTLPYTRFDELSSLFVGLIIDNSMKKTFQNFKLDDINQAIHNYQVTPYQADAKSLCDNLIPLLEFMLQEESDLLNSLDITKL